MILNWQNHLNFPSSPRVSAEAVNLMQSLICEPENRLGSQEASSVVRSASTLAKQGMGPRTLGIRNRSVDGARLIKVRDQVTVYTVT